MASRWLKVAEATACRQGHGWRQAIQRQLRAGQAETSRRHTRAWLRRRRRRSLLALWCALSARSARGLSVLDGRGRVENRPLYGGGMVGIFDKDVFVEYQGSRDGAAMPRPRRVQQGETCTVRAIPRVAGY